MAITTIVLSCDKVTVKFDRDLQFTALAYDENDDVIEGVVFEWSATGGTIDENGLFTAGAIAGSFEVTCSSEGVEDTYAFTVVKTPIDPRIMYNIEKTLKTVTIANGYNTGIERVERKRSDDKIDAYPYAVIIPNAPDNEFENSARADSLNIYIWYFDDKRDSGGVPFTERLECVAPDIEKALKIDITRGGLAQNTTIQDWDFDVSMIDGVATEGVWLLVKIDRMLKTGDPYTIEL